MPNVIVALFLCASLAGAVPMGASANAANSTGAPEVRPTHLLNAAKRYKRKKLNVRLLRRLLRRPSCSMCGSCFVCCAPDYDPYAVCR